MKKKERKTKLKERTRLWKEDNLSGQSEMVAETDAREKEEKRKMCRTTNHCKPKNAARRVNKP